MSANATDTVPLSLNGIIQPSLYTLMLSHTFLSLLIPLFFSLFYFSTPQGRRKPIFILNVVAIFLAFVVGVLCDGVAVSPICAGMVDQVKSLIDTQICSMLDPLNPWPIPVCWLPVVLWALISFFQVSLAVGFVGIWQSIIVDLTLLLRVVIVYPRAHLGPIRFSLLIATPVLLKLLRIINLIIFIKAVVGGLNGPNATILEESAFSSIPYIKIEWTAQLIENT